MEKKHEQLGMNFGTASARLRKMVMFELLKELKKNTCFQCGKPIELCSELSMEHKIPWLDSENPIELFFDLNNISFSHLSCNAGAARSAKKGTGLPHTYYSYQKGCRCDKCRALNAERVRKVRAKHKQRF